MNNGILPAHLTCASDQFGELEKAGAFVYREFEPADKVTQDYVEELLAKLGLSPKGPITKKKYLRCLSDLLVAARTTPTGKIAWPGGSDEYYGEPYGYDVAKTVRDSMLMSGYMTLAQKASKKDGLARLYKVDPTICPDHLRFRQHGEGPLIMVRSPKERQQGIVIGGARMGRFKFLPDIAELEAEVAQINVQMLQHPLCGADGTEYVRCYRIFNNGSLEAGGRLYGRWQGLPEEDRLKMTIDGEPVCEIDIKASFLSIAAGSTKHNQRLAADPYMMIPFVRDAEDQQTMRQVAKLLVNAYLCKEGDLVQFPHGEKKKGEEKTVPFQKRHGLQHNVHYYMDHIHSTFPFLKRVKLDGFGLMYMESQIMLEAMLALLSQGIVSYPVHDCLLVKKSDQKAAIEALHTALANHLNQIPTMDVSWLEDGEIKTYLVKNQHAENDLESNIDDYSDYIDQIEDDDLEVLEDFYLTKSNNSNGLEVSI